MTPLLSPRTHFQHAGRGRFTSKIERLEDRIAPANNVVTSFLGGTLTITTVDLLDEASVLAGDNDQNFQILAGGAGNVTVHKIGATDIDGGAADVPFAGVVNIVLDLKEGTDTVSLKGGVNLSGDVTFKGGDGGSLFEFDGDAATTTVRNLSIINGDGVENITFKDGDVQITGNLTINNGDGGSNMNIGFNVTDHVTIGGALSIVSGAGADGLNFNGADLLVKGPVSLKGGTGNTFISFKYQNSTVLEQPLTVVNGAADNVFETNNFNKNFSVPSIKITNGPGNSRVTFDSSVSDTIAGDVTVTNGAGDNKFEVKDGAFSVGGKIKITNGAGKSTTDLSPTGTNTVTGDFTLTNGVGDDTTTIGGTDVTYKNLKLVNGSGASTTSLTGTNLTFASISSTSSDGADTFTVNATNDFKVLTGGVTLKQGNGTTSTTIGAGGTGAIAGALNITNGEGKDTQIIGNGAGNFSGLHSVTIANGRGGSTTTFNPAQLTIVGSVAVSSGEGADTLNVGNGALTAFTISGSVKVTNGLGGSTTKLNPTTTGNLTGAFTVTAADGNDTVEVNRSTIIGATTVNVGAGNDTIRIDNSIVAALKFLTGSGNDSVDIGTTTNDGSGTNILGAVNIDLGSGNDTILWGLDANDSVTASQSVKLIGGTGLDEFNQNAATNVFAVAPTLASFEIQLP